MVIYWPQLSRAKGSFNELFWEEFHSLIDWLLTRNHNNICTCAATCMEILKKLDYTQHVKQPTHKGIHILDLIIARSKDNIVRHTSVVDLGLSDHYAVRCKVLLGNWLLSKRKKLTKISLKRIDDAPARSKVGTLCPNVSLVLLRDSRTH